MTYRPEFSLFFVVFNISIKVINNFCGGLKEERKKNPTATCQAPINQYLK